MSATTRMEQAILDFIDERRNAKIEKVPKPRPGQEAEWERKLREIDDRHEPKTWIADAARRAKRIKLATHVPKFTHPDAKGSSLYCHRDDLPDERDGFVGSHSAAWLRPDVTGDAGALDVFKLLSIEVDGVPLWQRARNGAPEFRDALPGGIEDADAWLKAFAALSQEDQVPASHALVKQVYWPVAPGEYHLLQPMYPTSLAHCVWERLQEARFSDEATAAREARRQGKPHGRGFRDWPGLLERKFGGTKPQNISQLNSKRRGAAWLLPAVPPQWDARGLTWPRNVKTVFGRSMPRRVREELRKLEKFLARNQDRNNADIRQKRDRLVESIVDDVIGYAGKIQALDPGWSDSDECALPDAEKYWLDPERDDEGFQVSRASADWSSDVAKAFGAWVNEALIRGRLSSVGDVEHRVWTREFESGMAEHLREIGNA